MYQHLTRSLPRAGAAIPKPDLPNQGGFFMATNSKEVQKKADSKRAGKRARAWWGVLYPKSAPEGWRSMIADDLVETLISPLHDKDILPNGEPKKPHYHVLISFKNPVTRQAAAETMKRWGVVVQEHWPKPGEPDSFKVKDFRQAARYLCHLDQADKHRYEISEVQSIGAIDYAALVMSATDEDAMLEEIFDCMDLYGLDTYAAVVRWTKAQRPEWKPIVYRKYTRQISEYAKGIQFENKRGYAAGVDAADGSTEESAGGAS